MTWLTSHPHGYRLTLYIQPSAKKTEITGWHDGALKIRLAAPPVDGQANTALLKFLAKTLRLPQRQVVLHSGETQRRKIVDILNTSPEIEAQLCACIPPSAAL